MSERIKRPEELTDAEAAAFLRYLYVYEEKPEARSIIEEVLKVWIKEVEEKVPPTELPEGVYTVPFEMKDEKFAEMVENIFETIIAGKCVYKSPVNIDNVMRTVMREKDTGVETIITVSCKDNENAMSLRQTLDWVLFETIKVVAVRRQKNIVEVGYIKVGLKPPPVKEKYIYAFKKTDGWTLEKEVK